MSVTLKHYKISRSYRDYRVIDKETQAKTMQLNRASHMSKSAALASFRPIIAKKINK